MLLQHDPFRDLDRFMILEATTLVEPASATQQDILVLLLEDREWVTREFTAIMAASGFGDRVIVGARPNPPDNSKWRGDRKPERRRSGGFPAVGVGARVRSPPNRP